MNEAAQERVLLVEDDDSFRRALAEVLASEGYAISTAPDAAEALEILQQETIDAVVTDLRMPGMKGNQLLTEIRAIWPEIPVIAITAFGSVQSAMELVRAGAADYLTKPFRTRDLVSALQRVLETTRERRRQARARRNVGEFLDEIVGATRPMLRLFDRIGRVAGSPAPVLITGETGTGKELVARAIHRASARGAFIPVNCGAIPDHLLESELFGHVKGAFTGADREKPGVFQAADGGTLFLDEIAELPLPLQPKLLRALETGEVRPVGQAEPQHVDVRIVAATHQDLEARVAAGEFRDDLFWRLNVLHLEIPPLRERPGDIPLLVEDFLGRIASRVGGRDMRVSTDALALLIGQPWPGNVRQLFSVLERAIAFSDHPEITPDDLPESIRTTGRAQQIARDTLERELTLAEVEREVIFEALRRAGGNKTLAAERLGIPRRTLYRRLEEYGESSEP
jgi:DNA-binding NtrC family response regulator